MKKTSKEPQWSCWVKTQLNYRKVRCVWCKKAGQFRSKEEWHLTSSSNTLKLSTLASDGVSSLKKSTKSIGFWRSGRGLSRSSNYDAQLILVILNYNHRHIITNCSDISFCGKIDRYIIFLLVLLASICPDCQNHQI